MPNSYCIVDGSMGAMLIRHGVQFGAVPEDANLTNGEIVRGLHEDYIRAGARIVETLSLGANSATLADKGREKDLETLVTAAVRNARQAAGDKARVALSAGPTGRMLMPLGETDPKEIYDAYLSQMTIGKKAGADLAMIETQNDLAEARLAALAAKKAGLPFILSMTMETGGRTMMGNSPECCAVTAKALGAEAVGVNCVGDIDMLVSVMEKMAAATDLPLLTMPNAGTPEIKDGKQAYLLTPDEYGNWMRRLMDAGVSYLGGCCGTGPEHIERLPALIEGKAAPERFGEYPALATSRAVFTVKEAMDAPFAYKVESGADPYDVQEDLLDQEDASAFILDLSDLTRDEVRELCLSAVSALNQPVIYKAEEENLLACALFYTPGVCGVASGCDCAEFFGALKIVAD